MKYKLAIYILLMALFGCATEPQITELKRKETEGYAWISTLPDTNADYGSYPTDYQEIIKKYLERNLKDPESARYSEYTKPKKEHALENWHEKKAIYGYSVCVLINAKNSYGGYDVPPVLSSATIWSPIPVSKEIGREETLFRRADHRLPA